MRAREVRCNDGGEGETGDEEREAGFGGEHRERSGGVAACLPPEISCVVCSEEAALLDERGQHGCLGLEVEAGVGGARGGEARAWTPLVES
jgi:hypothetical protein